MDKMDKRSIRVIALPAFVVWSLVFFFPPVSVETVLAAEPDQMKPASLNRSDVAVYDADPQHLWNRLYDALYVRTTEDGQSLGRGELDPLLWESSTYLLTEPRYHDASADTDSCTSPPPALQPASQ